MKVYLAGNISGLSFEDSQNWRDLAKANLAEFGIKAYSPLRGKEFLKGKGILQGSYNFNPLATQKGLFARDVFDVSTCDLMLVNLLYSPRISIGTIFEMGACFSLRKPIILIMEKGNIHEHPFILESSSYIVETLEEALELTKLILNA